MPRIALVTDRERPRLTHDDRLLLPAFEARGLAAAAEVWGEPEVDWAGYDAVIVRSPWDYHRRFAAWSAWVDGLEVAGARVWNPPPVLRWNARKAYLQELAGLGAPSIPTVRVAAGEGVSLRAVAAERDWAELVVKAEVSGGGAHTWRVGQGNVDLVQREVDAVAAGKAFLIQPFLSAVGAGEVSLVYFDRVYSHAVLKQPAKGGFLVHEEHGGSLRQHEPEPAWREAADHVLSLASGDLLYARVDLIGTPAGPVLVELELIEPELFVRFHGEAPDRLARAVAARV